MRVRHILILFLVVFVVAAAAYVAYQGIETLGVLTRVEAERDTWQRPADVIAALGLTEGSVVVDLGSGSGYFALKLARATGERGAVLAVDVRRLPLVFLWIRALQHGDRNLHVIHGEPEEPHLPPAAIDAVLIANTYHELARPAPLLDRLFQSLRSGGRLVVVDRAPRAGVHDSRAEAAAHHELPLALVEREIAARGFAPLSRQDPFIDRPEDDHVWWLAVFQKP